MNYLNRIIPKYNYNYFDAFNQLQTKQLNIFQCIIRRAFGFYAETHLSIVVKKAYIVTLNDQQHVASSKTQQALLKLIAKRTSKLYSQSHIQLNNRTLPSGEKVSVGIRYVIEEPKSRSDKYKISSIDFQLIFSRYHQVHHISIYKNKSKQIAVYLKQVVLFNGVIFDTENSIKDYLNNQCVKTINDLLAKILNDSSKVDVIRHYAGDYQRLTDFGLYHKRLNKSTKAKKFNKAQKAAIAKKLNKAQEEAMNQLGWEHIPEESEQHAEVKRVYLLRKTAAAKNQTLASLGLQQPFSIATSLLKTNKQEYIGH